MEIISVYDKGFAPYGKVIEGYNFTGLLEKLRETTSRPADGVVYVPSDSGLEAQPAASQLKNRFYGGMPIQIGYCNGSNRKLNCLEYHRDSEVNIAADDIVLMLSLLYKAEGGKLNTAEVEAFLVPAGTAVQLYETTLHYAPMNAPGGAGFRVSVVLPRGTNTEIPEIVIQNEEDKLLWARNKWLIAHPDSDEAKQGAFVGLWGENKTLGD